MMLGCLIRVFSIAAVATASSFGEITPEPEVHITVLKGANLDRPADNLVVSNGEHGRLTISKDLRDGKVTINCSGSCAAYVQYDGEYARYEWQITASLANPRLGPIRTVFFMLGGPETDVKSLESECWDAQAQTDYEHLHTLYTVHIIQEEMEVEAATPCPYFGNIIPSPDVRCGLKVSKTIDTNGHVTYLKVSNEHGQLTIERELMRRKALGANYVTVSCSGSCVAYVKHPNENIYSHVVKMTVFIEGVNFRVERVHFILGDAETNAKDLKEKLEAALDRPDDDHQYILYTIPFPEDQKDEDEEEEEVEGESK